MYMYYISAPTPTAKKKINIVICNIIFASSVTVYMHVNVDVHSPFTMSMIFLLFFNHFLYGGGGTMCQVVRNDT